MWEGTQPTKTSAQCIIVSNLVAVHQTVRTYTAESKLDLDFGKDAQNLTHLSQVHNLTFCPNL